MARLIVTSHRNGKSSVGSDQSIPAMPFVSVPGFDTTLLWGTPQTPSVPWDGCNVADDRKSVLPDVGETRLMKVTFPPDSVMMSPDFDPAAAGAEYTSQGRTQVVTPSSFTLPGRGDFAVFSFISFPWSCSRVLWLKPVPTWPMYRHAPSSRTARTSAPKNGLVRLGAVKPAITTSCRCALFTLSQSAVRPPDAYALSARFAMMPSRPFFSASAKNVWPLPLRCGLNAISLCRGKIDLSRFLRSRRGSFRRSSPSANMRSNVQYSSRASSRSAF